MKKSLILTVVFAFIVNSALFSAPDLTKIGTYKCGKQPTGLDLNAEGNILCSSNFQDQNIELYSVAVE